jgi:PKD repeat protein
VDRHGNVLVTWGTDSAGIKHALVGGLDSGDKPSLRLSSAPTKVVAGSRTALAAKAGDPSGIASVKWDFGDRSRRASGAEVKHAWRRPGTYTVQVKATDRAGFSTVRKLKVKVVSG